LSFKNLYPPTSPASVLTGGPTSNGTYLVIKSGIVRAYLLAEGSTVNNGVSDWYLDDGTNWGYLRFDMRPGNPSTITGLNGNPQFYPGDFNNFGFGFDGNGNQALAGLMKNYNSIATAGLGVPGIYAATVSKAETGTADATLLDYPPPATAGVYRISVQADVKTATSGVISFSVTHDDSAGAEVAAAVMSIYQLGTAAPALSFTTSAVSHYYGSYICSIDNGGEHITVGWVGGGTQTTNVTATLEQLA
jgi:hypothetical protein